MPSTGGSLRKWRGADYWPSARSTIFRTGRLLTPLMPRESARRALQSAETLARLGCVYGRFAALATGCGVARARRHRLMFRRPDDPGAEAFQHAFLGCVRPHGAARAHGNPAPL
jgi:hypothetical protein